MAEDESSNAEVVEWAVRQGVDCDGVKPANLPGRGRGMIATRKLNRGDQIIRAPSSSLLTVDSDAAFLRKHAHQIKNSSLHGRIAANLVRILVVPNHPQLAWARVVPTLQELKDCMPIFWPQELHKCLPESTQALLSKQGEKAFADRSVMAEEYLPNIAEETQLDLEDLKEIYMQSWMLVNSRCFYWDFEYPMPMLKDGERWPAVWKRPVKRQRTKGRDRDDCMALCPVIDCFNHSVEESCTVTFDERGFFVTCVRNCEPGEELHITYGSHSNDYLLVEYGFLLDQNENDCTMLDSVILPRLSLSQQENLKDENLLGTYTLDSSGVCHRTQCALRILLLPLSKWRRFVSGVDDGEKQQNMVDKLLRTLLNDCLKMTKNKKQQAREFLLSSKLSTVNLEGATAAVLKRLGEVDEMIENCLKRIS